MMSKIYRLICILDSISEPYLHIHILESECLAPVSEFTKKLSPKNKSDVLYQWGDLSDLKNKTRSSKISAAEIKKFGQIGIGSLWQGDEQNGGVGGGEAFLFGAQNFRITKGNEVFEVGDEEKYWTFQVADFSGAKIISELRDVEIQGRENLLKIFQERSAGQFFIAIFDAEFLGDFFARSNGIFPQDNVAEPSKSLFEEKIKGGHLLGGSSNSGDIQSLKNKFSEQGARAYDFSLLIKSDIVLKSCTKIVRPDLNQVG